MANDIQLDRTPSNGSSDQEKDIIKGDQEIVSTLAREDVEATLRQNYLDHRLDDPNMEPSKLDTVEAVLESGNYKAEVMLEEELEEDSPYPEVRAAVSNLDDPSMPVLTFRAWTLGLLFSIIIPGINQLLSYRYPTVAISSFVTQLVAYPMGKFMAAYLPTKVFKTPIGSFTLNPGPFNVKEHTIITVMSNVTAGRAYASQIQAVQRYFYGFDWGYGWILLVTMSTQLIGFSMAGVFRRWLVWPAAMIWPGNLGNTALFTALHRQVETGSGHMSRYKMFMLTFLGSFVWYFFPGYIFSALSYGCWACLAHPNNFVVNQVFGTVHGLGLLPTTLDWSQITYIANPLYTPWWSIANSLAGFIVPFAIVCPVLYHYNIWNSAYFPFSAAGTYDRFSKSYKPAEVLSADRLHFVAEKYNNYSEEYFPITFAIAYGLGFAAIMATIVHVGLMHGRSVWKQFKTSIHEEKDIHARLMQRYPESPKWWYIALFVITFAMGLGAVLGWDTGMPAWAYILSLFIGFIFLLPVGIILAISNQQVGLNLFTELIIGYAHPGHATSMMLFKTWGYMSVNQGLSFTQDQKIGHYMKIPPRAMFICQVAAIVISNFVVLAVQAWSFTNVKGICTTEASDNFYCYNVKTFGTASEIWGLIGPHAVFSPGRQYGKLLWMFLVGAICPVLTWALAKRFPHSPARLFNAPVFFTGAGYLPPATGINFTSWALVGFIFNYILKRKATGWWNRYNYVFGAGLDTGLAISSVFIFFVLVFPNTPARTFADSGWWGNSAPGNTMDSMGTPRLKAPAQGFAPAPKDFRPY